MKDPYTPLYGTLILSTFPIVVAYIVDYPYTLWDKMLDLENYKTFIFLYSSFEDNGNLSHSIKRVSIHKQNYMTSEITVPMTNDMPSYFIGRLCKGEKETDVISMHKADAKIDVVAAASIIAKETRENEIRKLKEEIGDFGSGYPSDERTIKFLKSFYADNGKWPTGTRKSWKTVERIRPVKTLDDFGERE